MSDLSRRAFLRLSAVSVSLLTAPVPVLAARLVSDPELQEGLPPDQWTLYSTTCRECPAGCGMQARVMASRTRKVEGMADHPVGRGGLCPRGQSAPQGLYDPDRIRTPMRRKEDGTLAASTWKETLESLGPILNRAHRVVVVSDLQNGALAEVMHTLCESWQSPPPMFFEPFAHTGLRRAHETLYGVGAIPAYRFEDSHELLSFSADFLETWISNVEYAAQFAAMRDPGRGGMGGFTYVGPRLSMTAANADEFLQVPPGAESLVARGMLEVLVREGLARRHDPLLDAAARDFDPAWLDRANISRDRVAHLARRFVAERGGVAIGGAVGSEGPAAQALAESVALLNHAAGGLGAQVDVTRPHALSSAMGPVELGLALADLGPSDVVLVHQCDPVYANPGLAETLSGAGTLVSLVQLADSTAELAHWVLPVDSPLEAFGDYSPRAGVHCLQQPTMSRLHDSRPAGDVLLSLAQAGGRSLARRSRTPAGGQDPAGSYPAEHFLAWLKDRWREFGEEVDPEAGFDGFWRQALIRGGIWQEMPALGEQPGLVARYGSLQPVRPVADRSDPTVAELWSWGSVKFFDGRVANRGWLQEVPEPVSFTVWGSLLEMHPDRAVALGLSQGDIAQVSANGGTLRVPVRVTREIHPRAVALGFGQGHHALGGTARGVGVNAFSLLGRGEEGDSLFSQVELARIGNGPELVPLTSSMDQHDREILQHISLDEAVEADMGRAEELYMPLAEGYEETRDLYEGHEHAGHRWAMVIDLNRCIGCGACSAACYAENNIPVVGKDRAEAGRDMSWIKPYPYQLEDDPMVRAWIPLACQHCDAAPCEPVCPVFASVHSEEGLNAQIYNRCVGTRYCSNNCPYKVRRFNWFDPAWRPGLEPQLNPEVTVRCRGVMEKCTFCVQRIRRAEHQARLEGRELVDGEVTPACAQSCPAGAFVFGDLMDQASRVSRIVARDVRRYQVLAERNTKPAVFYLKKIVRGRPHNPDNGEAQS